MVRQLLDRITQFVHPYILASIIMCCYSCIFGILLVKLGILVGLFHSFNLISVTISLFTLWSLSCYMMFRFSK